MTVTDLFRRHGSSEASYCLWRSKFGGMSVSDAKRLKELESGSTREVRGIGHVGTVDLALRINNVADLEKAKSYLRSRYESS